MLATAVKHEWEKDSPVLSFEVNGAVLQNDWSMGKHHLVNVFSVQCDRGTAARLFSPPPQGANFTPGKIVMETFYRTQLFGHLNDANFVAKEPVLPKGTSRKRKAKSAQSTPPPQPTGSASTWSGPAPPVYENETFTPSKPT